MIVYKLEVAMDKSAPWVSLETSREIGFLSRYSVGQAGEGVSKLRFEFIVDGIPRGRAKMKEADIYHVSSGVQAFSLDAVRVLAPMLTGQGSRFEQIKCEGVSLFLLTDLPAIEAIDLHLSKYTQWEESVGGGVREIQEYVFASEKIGNFVLFKEAQVHAYLQTFCTERVRLAVENAKLRGFKFTQLWPKAPSAKPKAAARRAKAERKPKKCKEPTPTVLPLDAEEAVEVNNCVAQWEAISGLSTSADPPEVVLLRICEQLMARRDEEEASDEFAMMTAMAAARVYERALGWRLHRVTLDGQVSYGCVAPDMAHILMPLDSVFAALDENEDPTLLLWFNMIREGGAPESRPGALLMLE